MGYRFAPRSATDGCNALLRLNFRGSSSRTAPIFLLGGFVAITMGFADAEEAPAWTDGAAGVTDVSGIGSVRYNVGYSSVGFDHFRSEISVEWHDGGDRTQIIYDGIYDNPPAKVWGADGHLCVSMEACARGEDACTTQAIAFRYDSSAKSFAELDDDAGQCGQ